jgi:osmotically-inducible protein OsmY
MKRSKIYTLFTLLLWLPASFIHAQELNNETLTAAVERQLEKKLPIQGLTLETDADSGIVSLEGIAPNLLLKKLAADVALAVRGVVGVVNLIEVEVPQVHDDSLEEKINRQLAIEPALDGEQVSATVNKGHVILSGQADSYQKMKLAQEVAAGVKGVKNVVNYLVYLSGEDRPDSVIEEEIRQNLVYDARIDESDLQVEVQEQNVFLSGTVASAYEKRRAEFNAWVPGADSVISEDLKVNPDFVSRKVYKPVNDEEIAGAVGRVLEMDPRVNREKIDVAVEQGRVTLSGNIASLTAKFAAESTAFNVAGVQVIINELEVKPEEIPDDRELAARARSEIVWDPVLNPDNIEVTAYGGKLFLNGKVGSYFEKIRARDAVADIEGVVEIDNQIFVERPEAIEEGLNVERTEADVPVVPEKSDEEIAEATRNELWWSPFVDQDQIEVKVEDGVATLTGTVNTWRQRNLAGINAYEAGAVFVNNQLKVKESLEEVME